MEQNKKTEILGYFVMVKVPNEKEDATASWAVKCGGSIGEVKPNTNNGTSTMNFFFREDHRAKMDTFTDGLDVAIS